MSTRLKSKGLKYSSGIFIINTCAFENKVLQTLKTIYYKCTFCEKLLFKTLAICNNYCKFYVILKT